MRVNVQARAGASADAQIEVRNALGEPQTILVETIDLWQDPDGSWAPMLPEQAQEKAELRSCLDWISLGNESLELGQYGSKDINISVEIPRAARGTYSAALLVRSSEPQQQGGVAVVIQFLVPVIVEVQGRSARERVDFTKVELLQSDDSGSQAEASVAASISNDGETMVVVGGELRLLSKQGGRWQPIATVPLRQRSMLPGLELRLQGSVGRRLPSGSYRIEGRLSANGRRLGTVIEEVEFEGDPEAALLSDLPLEVEPLTALEAVPGSVRSGGVTVTNPSTQLAEIEASVVKHPALLGVGNDEVDGSDLDASGWISALPERFPVRGNGERTLRLLVRTPELEEPLANYYALLKLESSYAEGQPAGGAESLLWLHNSDLESRLAAEALSLSVNEAAPNRYAVTARIVNSGTIHWVGNCVAELQASATEIILTQELETTTPVVLPLDTASYSGVLDFSEVEAGSYALRITLGYADEELRQLLPIEVSVDEDGRRTVTVIEDSTEGEDTEAP